MVAVSSRKTSLSGSGSGRAANHASRAAFTAASSCSAAYTAPFGGDPATDKEPRKAARGGLHAQLNQGVAQFMHKDLRPGLVGGEDQARVHLNRPGAVVPLRRFGRSVALLSEPLRPGTSARHAHAELGGRNGRKRPQPKQPRRARADQPTTVKAWQALSPVNAPAADPSHHIRAKLWSHLSSP